MATYDLLRASGIFKTKYVRMSRDMFNSENVILAKIKRNDNFTGTLGIYSVPTSFGGGRGSGTLPKANTANYQQMQFTAKKVYATVEVDNEAIKASSNDEGAFVRLSREPVKRGVQSWQANASRILFNDTTSGAGAGNGRLGTFTNAQALVATDVYDVTVDLAAWKQANWETRDYVNVGTGPALFEVTNVTPATRVVRLTQVDGPTLNLATLPNANYSVYMQGSRGNDPTGIRGCLLATTGALYGINVGYRWQASYQNLNVAIGITPDLLNEGMLAVKYAFGETPDMLVTSFVQYRKLLNQLEDQKRYMVVESRNEGPRGKFSFSALEFMADTGPVPVIAERFVEDDTFYFLNSDFIEMHARPDGGWIEDPTNGGGIFSRSPTQDTWQARYGVYFEFTIMPTAHGIITGLTTT